jgi:hypothetical protein
MKIEGTADAIRSNPLLMHHLDSIKNWNQWMKHWRKTETVEEMVGLLHAGFDIPDSYGNSPLEKSHETESKIDRILFYLSLADGWTSPIKTEGEELNSEKPLMRQEVAEKAFEMLCCNFFGEQPKQHSSGDPNLREKDRHITQVEWEKKVHPLILKALMNFFRVKVTSSNFVTVSNIARHRSNFKLVRPFLIGLSRFLFTWQKHYVSSFDTKESSVAHKTNGQFGKILPEARLWMIEILAHLHEIDELKHRELDQACVEKIKEIAMREAFETHDSLQVLGVPANRRPVTSLDEACYLGSECAWLLKYRELMDRESARLKALGEAEKKIEAAQREARALQAQST